MSAVAIARNEKRYFNYLISYVYDKNSRRSYIKLLEFLYNKNFIWTVYMDKNRAADGLALRARFFNDNCLDKPCSVLEMMVGLADRMENHLLWDPNEGDRTGQWFWVMINNMGLSNMYDKEFNEDYCEECVGRMLHREYDYHGKGGLFTVNNPLGDMRDTEIWYQMNWWITENY